MRRQIKFIVQTEGRDKGKQFVITEMSAENAERWAIRALLGMASGGVEIPDSIASAGMAGIASMGVGMLGKLPPDLAQELLDEMFRCVQYVPNPARPEIAPRDPLPDDIEEVATRIRLRLEVFRLHVDFSSVAALFSPDPAAQEPQG